MTSEIYCRDETSSNGFLRGLGVALRSVERRLQIGELTDAQGAELIHRFHAFIDAYPGNAEETSRARNDLRVTERVHLAVFERRNSNWSH
jgi:hypothetical protein